VSEPLPPAGENPFAPPATRVDDMPGAPATELHYAGFWIRVWASIIDTFLTLLVIFPLLTAIYGLAYWESEKFIEGPVDLLISWVLPAVAVLAFWIYRQATPGKMAISARIVDAKTGRDPGTGQCIGRYLAYILASIPFGLGLLWVAFDPRKQGWHDKLAGTVVVRLKNGGGEPVRFDVG
jgi:uncharacterized RDD family membrane protein YckC